MTLADKLRHLMRYSRSISLMPTDDGQWQATARTPASAYTYICETHPDPVTAFEMMCDAAPPVGTPVYVAPCSICHGSGKRPGRINTLCICRKKHHDLFGPLE